MSRSEGKYFRLVPAGDDGRGGPLAGLPAAELLLEIHEIVSLRMAQLLPEVLGESAASLYRLSERAVDMEKRILYMEAGQLAQYRLGNLPQDFRRHFEHRYLGACKRDPWRRRSAMDDFDLSRLRIVEDDRLEPPLNANDLIRALSESCQEPLFHLVKHFQVLLRDAGMTATDLPVGPKALGQAVVDALGDQCAGHEPKIRLLQALARHLPIRVHTVYEDLLGHLERRMPEIAALGLLDGQGVVLPEVDLMEDGALPCQSERTHATACPAAPDGMPEPVPEAAGLDRESAACQASDEVRRRLAEPSLPEPVRTFLSEHWQAWLSLLLQRHGPQGEAWRGALDTMDDLIRSLAPPRGAEERSPRGLPALLRRLDEGMAALGTPAEKRDAFFSWLLEAQAEARRRDAPVIAQEPLLPEVIPPAYSPAVSEAQAVAGGCPAAVQEPSPAPPTQSAPPPCEPHAPQPAPEDAAPSEGQAQTQPEGRPTRPARLKRGTRLLLRAEGGASIEVKLAWISPGGGTMLFTHPQGQRALALTAGELEAWLRDGRARLLDDSRQDALKQPRDGRRQKVA